jgi:AcrR family transcriptional regulator
MDARSKTEDRRINRTQQSLRKALIELILEKHYDTISVQDIIDRANVGRSTFYTHFRDKEDLFRGDWERILNHFVDQIKIESLSEGRIFPIQALFAHLKDFHHFYRALVKSGKIEQIFSLGQRYMSKRIEERVILLLSIEENPLVPIPILANYLASEIFSNLKWWLDNNMPYSPEKMDEMFHSLVTPGFRQALLVEKNVSARD